MEYSQKNTPPQTVCVVGPTAAGKTELGVWLARHYNGEVVSCDSMQVYRRMDIGTAKPDLSERGGVAHHMLDVAEPWEDYSVERYCREAGACVDDILARSRLPIIVGGTGLYLEGLLAGRNYAARSSSRREELTAQYEKEGIGPLREQLERVDPESAARLSEHDVKRTIRALEVWYETGETISARNAASQRIPARYTALKIGLGFQNRADLYARIDARADEMVRRGLSEEVCALLASGVPPTATAMQAIGYKEWIPVIRGDISPEEALSEIKQRSRRYAKRQLSWFRRDSDIAWCLQSAAANAAEREDFAAHAMAAAGFAPVESEEAGAAAKEESEK